MKTILLFAFTICLFTFSQVYSQQGGLSLDFSEKLVKQNSQESDQLITGNFYSLKGQNEQLPIFNLQNNDNFLMVQSYDLWWQNWNSSWEYTRKYFYAYDGNDNLIEKSEQMMNSSEPVEKKSYYYDNNNFLLEERVFEHDNSEWILRKKILYYYDSITHNLVQELSQLPNGSEFENEIKTVYVYDENNNRSYLIDQRWEDETWVNSLKLIDYFDVNNNRNKVEVKHWVDEENLWVNGTRTEYTYDEESNNLIMIASQNWDRENSEWNKTLYRQTYVYDEDNNRIIFLFETWHDEANPYWQKDFMQTYYYLPRENEQIIRIRSDVNKTIEDSKTTEDDLIVNQEKRASLNNTLIGVEVLLDTLLHTSVGDLELTLSHNGIIDTLIFREGGDGDNFIGTKITDKGVLEFTEGVAPFVGNYKPKNSLSRFLGIDPSGTWTLSIYDGVAGNTGVLKSWGLNLIYSSNIAVGIETVREFPFKVFPNPAQGRFKVQSSKFRVEEAIIEVYDLNGRKLLEKQIPTEDEIVEIDANSLKTGIYFCRIIFENSSSTLKIVIQK